MKNLRGIIVAAVFVALAVILQQVAAHFGILMGMAYPFASKTIVEFLAAWTAEFDFVLWQSVVAVYLVAVVVSFGLMILFRWNFLRWLGWVLAPAAVTYFLFTAVWGLNNYTKPLNESMKLEVTDYTVTELKEAAEFYCQQADRLAGQILRDENGDVVLPTLEEMNQIMTDSYNDLVWEFSIFAGPRGPVKELGWSSLFSRFGVDGVTMALTGEAAVNLEQYGSRIPFNMCHEVAHQLAISREDEANFAGFLACERSENTLFRYSGYLEAFLACSNTLYDFSYSDWQEVWQGASESLRHDVEQLNQVAASREGPVQDAAQSTYSSYLEHNGQEAGVATYGRVTDLLVAWYQARYVIDTTPEPTQFDPLRYEDVFPEPVTTATEDTAATQEG